MTTRTAPPPPPPASTTIITDLVPVEERSSSQQRTPTTAAGVLAEGSSGGLPGGELLAVPSLADAPAPAMAPALALDLATLADKPSSSSKRGCYYFDGPLVEQPSAAAAAHGLPRSCWEGHNPRSSGSAGGGSSGRGGRAGGGGGDRLGFVVEPSTRTSEHGRRAYAAAMKGSSGGGSAGGGELGRRQDGGDLGGGIWTGALSQEKLGLLTGMRVLCLDIFVSRIGGGEIRRWRPAEVSFRPCPTS